MYLIIDIGNTFIKLAIFQDGKIVYNKRVKKVLVRDIKAINKKYPFSASIVSSVRVKSAYFIEYLKKNHNLLELTHKTKVPIKNRYKTPRTLGLDRLAAVVGAANMYPKKNCLVIDIGTCMTYDFIDDKRNYFGGNIAPGVELRLMSMHHFTSALPLLKRKWHAEMLGDTTKSAMQNGAVWGVKLEIEAFIKTLTSKKGKMAVLLTGGDASYFGEIIDSEIFVAPNLLLKGLHDILEYNL